MMHISASVFITSQLDSFVHLLYSASYLFPHFIIINHSNYSISSNCYHFHLNRPSRPPPPPNRNFNPLPICHLLSNLILHNLVLKITLIF